MEDETILIAVPKMRPLDREVGANAALLRRTAQVNGYVLPPPAHATRPQLFGWQALPWAPKNCGWGERGRGPCKADGGGRTRRSHILCGQACRLLSYQEQDAAAVDNAWLPGRVLSLLS